MKHLLLLSFLSTLILACSHTNQSRQISSIDYAVIDCIEGICANDELIIFNEIDEKRHERPHLPEIKLEDARVTVDEVRIYPPKYGHKFIALVTTQSGKKKLIALKFATKVTNSQTCINQGGHKVCTGDEVLRHSKDGTYKSEVLAIQPNRNDDPDFQIFWDHVLLYSKDRKSLIANPSFAVIKPGTCHKEDKTVCVDQTYDNKLGSEDKILGFFPSGEILILAGSSGENHVVSLKEVKSRMKGEYTHISEYTMSFDVEKNFKKAIEEKAKDSAKFFCQKYFLNQGVLDETYKSELKIKMCRPNHPGVKPLFHCDVQYKYQCIHKQLVK